MKTLTRDLKEKGLAEDELVGYGQNAVGAIAALSSPMYAISCANGKIITYEDVMGDLFDKQDDEVSIDKNAIRKQEEIIDKLH